MKRFRRGHLLAIAMFLVPFGVHSAYSQVYVSPDGTDQTLCGQQPSSACETIDFAMTQIINGLILVLPGKYQSVQITKSIDLIAEGGSTTIGTGFATGACGGSAAICVAAPADAVVRVRGFTLASTNGAYGIVFNSGAALFLEDFTISGRAPYAIRFQPSGASELYVSDGVIYNRGLDVAGGGILIKPTGSASATAAFDNVKVENNATGIVADGTATSGPITLAISDSVVSGNTGHGIVVQNSGNGNVTVSVEDSQISHNGSRGAFASGTGATVRLGGSLITNNAVAFSTSGGAQVISLGGNSVVGNAATGPFNGTVAPQ